MLPRRRSRLCSVPRTFATAVKDEASTLQDSRINYVEQHAERFGLDTERLENLRVSASRSSQMGDTLDLCARHADAAALEGLVPRLVQLIRRGVGLNTRLSSLAKCRMQRATFETISPVPACCYLRYTVQRFPICFGQFTTRTPGCRVGTARFVTNVALRLGKDVSPQAGTLIKVNAREACGALMPAMPLICGVGLGNFNGTVTLQYAVFPFNQIIL